MRATAGKQAIELDEARDGKAVLGLVAVDGMAARDDAARLPALVRAAGEDLARHLYAEAIGKAQQVERERRRTSHGPDVGKGVGGGHLAEQERVVHHRWEEVRGLHEAAAVTQVVDAGVVGGVEAHDEPLVLEPGQVREHLGERFRRQLGRASRRLDKLCESHARHVHIPLAP